MNIKHTRLFLFFERHCYNLKKRIQRFKRGWSDYDAYSFYDWFIEMGAPILRHMANHLNSTPIGISEEEWQNIIFDMADLLENCNIDTLMDKGYNYEAAAHQAALNKDVFMGLFNEYFFDLWD